MHFEKRDLEIEGALRSKLLWPNCRNEKWVLSRETYTEYYDQVLSLLSSPVTFYEQKS